MSEDGSSSGLKRKADEENGIITVKEIIEMQKDSWERSDAILGASDADNCSYSKGYVPRQALYSCFTCIPESKTDISKAAGICLACCLTCHEDHDIEELFTKRDFRCDCGNSKFNNFICQLEPNKDTVNEKNSYNQNFSGLYCTCKRPYPDEEDDTNDTMIQCVICEDWFHSRHLGCEVPADYEELVCEECVKKHPFLLHYDHLCVNKDTETKNGVEQEVEIVDDSSCKMPKTSSNKICSKFWEDIIWREQLCRCDKCLKMYEEQNVTFITNIQDTIHAYEERGKIKIKEQEQELMNSLSSLPRVPLLETISAVQDLKEKLADFFREIADKGQVITAEDVREFFQRMNENKKAKFEQQYYCR